MAEDNYKAFGFGSCEAHLAAYICSAAALPLGYFAFFNPDNAAWYGETYGDDGEIIPYLYPDPTNQGWPLLDIHSRFVNWFISGFCLMLIPVVSVFGVTCIRNSQVIWPYYWAGIVVWGIIGLIWRFCYSGHYASGDNPSTKYMNDEQKAAWEAALTADDSLFQV